MRPSPAPSCAPSAAPSRAPSRGMLDFSSWRTARAPWRGTYGQPHDPLAGMVSGQAMERSLEHRWTFVGTFAGPCAGTFGSTIARTPGTFPRSIRSDAPLHRRPPRPMGSPSAGDPHHFWTTDRDRAGETFDAVRTRWPSFATSNGTLADPLAGNGDWPSPGTSLAIRRERS